MKVAKEPKPESIQGSGSSIDQGRDTPTTPATLKVPDSEDEIIFKSIQSLRNRAKKLSPEGRQRLFGMIRSYIGG